MSDEGKKQVKRKRNPLWNAVFWLTLVALLAVLGAVGYILYGYWSADSGYQEISNTAFDGQNPDLPEEALDSPEDDALASLSVDWEYLRSLNSDIVAWVYMPGTRINYPVVQGRDNDEYLHRDFSYADGFTARGGAIFMDAGNSPDFSDDAIYIYGHHMNDGSMFACLSTQLSDEAEFNAHRYIYVLTPDFNYRCETFSLLLSTGYESIVKLNFSDYEERLATIGELVERSIVVPSEGTVEPAEIGQMFVFATCDYNQQNGRALLATNVVSQVVPEPQPAKTFSTEDNGDSLGSL